MAQDRHRFQPPIATTPRREPPTDTIIIFILVILFLLFFFFFFFFLLPFSSHASKIIKPITPVKVKSNGNSLIVFLFVFAIIAGVLAQNNDPPSTPNANNRVNNRASESNRNRNQEVQLNGDLRRRSSNTELRKKPLPENGDSNHSRRREGRKENTHRSRRSEARKVNSRLEESIEVVPESPSPPPPAAAARAPALEPPVSGKSKRRKASRSLGLDQTVKVTSQNIRSHEGSHITPPQPSPPANREARDDKKEISPTIASLNNHRKRNRTNKKESRDIQPSIQKTPPPPPPPPPPRKSFFNNLFKSSVKNKRFPSSTAAASTSQSTVQPPSPPSQSKTKQPTVAMKQQSKPTIPIQPPIPPSQPSEPPHRRPASTHKPPLPTKSSNYYHDRDDFLSSSSHSQSSSSISISIPIPPPPPPPFEVSPIKFELHGDYHLRQLSVSSSDFSSRDRDDLRSPIIDGGDSFGPGPITSTPSSPDVNVKADIYISRLKRKWKTEY